MYVELRRDNLPFLELYKNLKTENILQNFNAQYFTKSNVTNNWCDIF